MGPAPGPLASARHALQFRPWHRRHRRAERSDRRLAVATTLRHVPRFEELERRFGLTTPEDADRAVEALVRLGADFVKIRNYPSAATYFELVRAAKRHHLAIAGHAPPLAFVATVSDSGMGSLEHALIAPGKSGLVEALSQMPEADRRDLFQRLSRNGTAWDPTYVSGVARLVPDSAIARMIADTVAASDPDLRYLNPELREEWRTGLAMRRVDPDTTTDWAAVHRASLTHARAMLDAGVVVLAGTDLSVLALLPGVSLHDELDILVKQAGLTPAEALRAATWHAANAVGLGAKSGSLEPGRYADLVLLGANPLADIAATRHIVAVVSNGRLFDREALNALVEESRRLVPRR